MVVAGSTAWYLCAGAWVRGCVGAPTVTSAEYYSPSCLKLPTPYGRYARAWVCQQRGQLQLSGCLHFHTLDGPDGTITYPSALRVAVIESGLEFICRRRTSLGDGTTNSTQLALTTAEKETGRYM